MEVEGQNAYGSGDSYLFDLSTDGLPAVEDAGGMPGSEAALAALVDEVRWGAMRNKGSPVPRLVAVQGHVDGPRVPLYRHPADVLPRCEPWTPTVGRIRDAVAARTGQTCNHALVQLYRTPADSISEHSDKVRAR